MYFTNHMFGIPLFTGFGAGLMILTTLLVVAFFALVILLKGYALWNAAKRDEMWWFIALLVVNTAGILELIYLIFIVKKWPHILPKKTEVIKDDK